MKFKIMFTYFFSKLERKLISLLKQHEPCANNFIDELASLFEKYENDIIARVSRKLGDMKDVVTPEFLFNTAYLAFEVKIQMKSSFKGYYECQNGANVSSDKAKFLFEEQVQFLKIIKKKSILEKKKYLNRILVSAGRPKLPE